MPFTHLHQATPTRSLQLQLQLAHQLLPPLRAAATSFHPSSHSNLPTTRGTAGHAPASSFMQPSVPVPVPLQLTLPTTPMPTRLNSNIAPHPIVEPPPGFGPPAAPPPTRPDSCNFRGCTAPHPTITSPLINCSNCWLLFCCSHLHLHESNTCLRLGSPSSPSLNTQHSDSQEDPDRHAALIQDPNISAAELQAIRSFQDASSNALRVASRSAPPRPSTPKHIICYAVGSKPRSSSTAGYGVQIVERGSEIDIDQNDLGKSIAELFGPVITLPSSSFFLGAEAHTDLTAELSAIAEALLWLADHRPSPMSLDLAIITNSAYCIDQLSKTKAATTNQLILRCRLLLAKCRASAPGTKVRFHLSSSHRMNKWNEQADQLSKLGPSHSSTLGRYSMNTCAIIEPTTQHNPQMSTD